MGRVADYTAKSVTLLTPKDHTSKGKNNKIST